MGSRLRSLRLGSLGIYINSGIGYHRAVTCLDRCAGWTSPKRMAERGRWVYLQSRIALRKRLFDDTWSPCWNQRFMPTLMVIDQGDRRSIVFGQLVSDAGGTTGFSILISRLSSTASIGNSCYVRCESTRSAGGFCCTSSVG